MLMYLVLFCMIFLFTPWGEKVPLWKPDMVEFFPSFGWPLRLTPRCRFRIWSKWHLRETPQKRILRRWWSTYLGQNIWPCQWSGWKSSNRKPYIALKNLFNHRIHFGAGLCTDKFVLSEKCGIRMNNHWANYQNCSCLFTTVDHVPNTYRTFVVISSLDVMRLYIFCEILWTFMTHLWSFMKSHECYDVCYDLSEFWKSVFYRWKSVILRQKAFFFDIFQWFWRKP